MTLSPASPAPPFGGPIPDTVPLPRSPLTGVLGQIAFPELLSLAEKGLAGRFQERIRGEYPLLQQDEDVQIEFGPGGMKQSTSVNWRFFDAGYTWRVSLTTRFVSVETRAYTNRAEFVGRLTQVARALAEAVDPKLVTRIGLRYVDRIHGEAFEKLDHIVRPEILGLYRSEHRAMISRSASEVYAQADVGGLSARWGFMDANQTHEPQLMPAISVPSWFLDIDAYMQFDTPEPFDVKSIEKRAFDLAGRSYGFFRWAVNDEFLRTYGGET